MPIGVLLLVSAVPGSQQLPQMGISHAVSPTVLPISGPAMGDAPSLRCQGASQVLRHQLNSCGWSWRVRRLGPARFSSCQGPLWPPFTARCQPMPASAVHDA